MPILPFLIFFIFLIILYIYLNSYFFYFGIGREFYHFENFAFFLSHFENHFGLWLAEPRQERASQPEPFFGLYHFENFAFFLSHFENLLFLA